MHSLAVWRGPCLLLEYVNFIQMPWQEPWLAGFSLSCINGEHFVNIPIRILKGSFLQVMATTGHVKAN